MNASQVIDIAGGTNAVARAFKISTASVANWRKNGIPANRVEGLRGMHKVLASLPDGKVEGSGRA